MATADRRIRPAQTPGQEVGPHIELSRLPGGLQLGPEIQLSLEYLQRTPLDLRHRRAAMDILAPGTTPLGNAGINPPGI